MGAILVDIRNALDAQFAWIDNSSDALRNIYMATLPDSILNPDPLTVGLWKYTGAAPKYMMGGTGKPKIVKPRLQVMVRNPTYALAESRAIEIYNYLTTIRDTILGGTRYHRIAALGEPADVGPDSSKRVRVVCNYEVWMEN